MTARDYLAVFRRRWPFVLAGLGAGIGMAVAAFLLTPNSYTARTSLYISSIAPADNPGAAYQASLLSAQRMKSYQQFVESRRVSQEVIDRLNLPISSTDLAAQIRASAEPESLVLTITVRDTSSERVRDIASTAAAVFIDLVADVERPADPTHDAVVRATVLEPAELPTTSSSPGPKLFLPLGVTIGLLLGAGAALARNALDTSIGSPHALAEATGVPLLVELPRIEDAPTDLSLLVVRKPQAPFSRSIRELRTALQVLETRGPCSVIVVSSPDASDGKTLVSVNLAASYALAGKRAVLVSGDLRRPRVEQYFGVASSRQGLTSLVNALPPGPAGRGAASEARTSAKPSARPDRDTDRTNGKSLVEADDSLPMRVESPVVSALREFNDVMIIDPAENDEMGGSTTQHYITSAGGNGSKAVPQVKVEDFVFPTFLPELHLMSAGPSSSDPADLLANRQVGQIVDSLRRHADVVIVDTPPVLSAPDAAIMASNADGMVLVVSARKTNRRMLHQALRRLRASQVNLLGIALNRSRPSTAEPYAGYQISN